MSRFGDYGEPMPARRPIPAHELVIGGTTFDVLEEALRRMSRMAQALQTARAADDDSATQAHVAELRRDFHFVGKALTQQFARFQELIEGESDE